MGAGDTGTRGRGDTEIAASPPRRVSASVSSRITHHIAISLACVVLAVVFWGLLQLDLPLARFVRSVHLPVLEQAGDVLGRLGSGVVLTVICGALLAAGWALKWPVWRRAGLEGLIAHAAAGLTAVVFKHLIGRPRPRLTHGDAFQFGPSWDSGLESFPSGHTTAAFAVAAVLAKRFPGFAWVWYGTVSLVAASRVLRGSHFPTDVLAGVGLGLLAGYVVANPIREWRASALRALTDSAPYLLGVFALLWIALHAAPAEPGGLIMLAAGAGMIALGTGIRLNCAFSAHRAPPPTPSPFKGEGKVGVNALIRAGLALTTGSLLIAALAALLIWAQWLAARGLRPFDKLTVPSLAEGQAQAAPSLSSLRVPSGSTQSGAEGSRGGTKLSPVERQPVVVEAVSVASLALAVLAIQAIKGLLPIL